MSTSASTEYATDVACAIYDAASPHLSDPSWCVNAAAIASHVLRALGEKSWPVQCTVLHANEPYARIIGTPAEAELPHWSEAQPGDPYCVWTQAMSLLVARRDEAQQEAAKRSGRMGLPGHVLTYVPGWRCWLDPSAEQFTKPVHSILLAPCVWPDVGDPPELAHWTRPDGGLTGIMPTTERGFTQATAWTRRGDDETRRIARRALELLAQDPPDGGRGELRIPGILSP